VTQRKQAARRTATLGRGNQRPQAWLLLDASSPPTFLLPFCLSAEWEKDQPEDVVSRLFSIVSRSPSLDPDLQRWPSRLRGEVGMKLRLPSGQEHNLQPALLPLGYRRSVDLREPRLPPVAGRVLHLHLPRPPQLNAIAEHSPEARVLAPKLALG